MGLQTKERGENDEPHPTIVDPSFARIDKIFKQSGQLPSGVNPTFYFSRDASWTIN